jgi:hypothetical protein
MQSVDLLYRVRSLQQNTFVCLDMLYVVSVCVDVMLNSHVSLSLLFTHELMTIFVH